MRDSDGPRQGIANIMWAAAKQVVCVCVCVCV